MKDKVKLKPCPFCGNPNVRVSYYHPDGVNRYRERYAVQCGYDDGGCGAESGHYHSIVEAAYMWNQRKRKWKP